MDGRIAPADRPGQGRTLAADAHARTEVGPLTLGLRAAASRRWSAALLVARGDTAWAYETAATPLDHAALTADAAWREATTRGVYVRAAATASAALRPDASPLHRREADALPRLHGTLRVGARATGVGGVLDLDLSATGRGWTAFASRIVEPATGALALPDPGSVLGAGVPAGGTVDVWATAAFSSRAIVVLGVENVVGRAVSVAVVPGEPLPGPVWRVGILWALLD